MAVISSQIVENHWNLYFFHIKFELKIAFLMCRSYHDNNKKKTRHTGNFPYQTLLSITVHVVRWVYNRQLFSSLLIVAIFPKKRQDFCSSKSKHKSSLTNQTTYVCNLFHVHSSYGVTGSLRTLLALASFELFFFFFRYVIFQA